MIRKGTKEDLRAAHQLIVELAIYENAPNEVETTVESMEKDGFGEDSIFEFFVAEDQGKIIGLALYYYRYSTWKGRSIYLEDLVVCEESRGKGFGKRLLDAVVYEAKRLNCNQVCWQVLDWNEPAINFYKSLNATLDAEWINCKLNKKQIQQY